MNRICIVVLILCMIMASTADGNPPNGFCSQVRQIEQSCAVWESSVQIQQDVRVVEGRVGKAGPRGPTGSPGKPGIVNYTAIDAKLAEKFQAMEERISTLEGKVAESNRKIQKMEEEMAPKTHNSCDSVSINEAKTWDRDGGIFDVYINSEKTEVLCDLRTDGGRWTVFQRRLDGSVSFNRNWDEYAAGFGSVAGEVWLGLEKIHHLTKKGDWELRIEIVDNANQMGYAKYGTFSVSEASDKYRLTVGEYSGTLPDQMTYHNNMFFSTPGRDSDTWSLNCAALLNSGWWFKSCIFSNLNGEYGRTYGTRAGSRGMYWYSWGSGHYKRARMMLRQKQA